VLHALIINLELEETNFNGMNNLRRRFEVLSLVLHTRAPFKRENRPKIPSLQHPIATHFVFGEMENST